MGLIGGVRDEHRFVPVVLLRFAVVLKYCRADGQLPKGIDQFSFRVRFCPH